MRITIIAFILFFITIPQQVYSQETQFKKSVKLGGRLMFDLTQYNYGSESFRGSEFRRIRLYGSSQLSKNMKVKVQVDFTGKSAIFRDVYLKFGGIPKIGGELFVGRFKEPSRLEQMTSSKHITFIERASLNNWINRNQGFLYNNSNIKDGKFAFQIAYLFGANSTNGINHILHSENEKALGKSISTRLTTLLIKDKENKKWLHFGVGYSYEIPDLSPDTSVLRSSKIKVRAPIHLAPKFGSHTFTNIENIQIFGVETFAILGPSSIQAEYVIAQIKNKNTVFTVPSYYAQFSYFITGECRNFKNSYVGFSGIKPKNNFSLIDGGWGAIELAVRYQNFIMTEITLDNSVSDFTFGINWYLNPHARIMYNFVVGNDGLVDDTLYGNVVRFQAAF